jgi:hypothetical protein
MLGMNDLPSQDCRAGQIGRYLRERRFSDLQLTVDAAFERADFVSRGRDTWTMMSITVAVAISLHSWSGLSYDVALEVSKGISRLDISLALQGIDDSDKSCWHTSL